ncbi:MAG: 50S ribosomal protein L31 [Magnetococcales bacterium]|nr:50S ribosomal protein L31 [Magnetococcales bacterium]NGZ27082.1 50S ribosomal protein L31 [Magnetococcales bacterium]
MKKDIHPNYTDTTFTCVGCGNVIQTKSTIGGTSTLGVCSSCHPFFTGKHKLVDTAGRVDRFRKKYAAFEQTKTAPKAKAAR